MLQLVYRDGEGERVVVRLEPGSLVTVGRNPGSTIQTNNPSVSRAHAEIQETAPGNWVARDLGSSNHTYVNETRNSTESLKAGDVVRFGDFRVKVQGLRGAAAQPASRDDQNEAAPAEGSSDRRARRKAEERERQARLEEKRRARQARKSQGAEGAEPQDPAPPPPTVQSDADEPTSRPAPEPAPVEADPVAEPVDIEEASGDEADLVAYELEGGSRSAESPAEPEESEGLFRLGQLAYPENIRHEQELLEREGRIQELELRCRELELREQRHDEELDGWHERYTRVKTRLEHAEGRVEKLQEEGDGLTSSLATAEAQVAELEARIHTLESSGSASDGQMTQLKLQVVHKDRRIEDLERELDMMEFDLREGREQLESLEASFNSDNREQRKLSRELELLREVIADKENVIGGLKKQIEESERQIYELKIGTGIKDLEDARQDVMDRFFEKSREVDELTEKLGEMERGAVNQQETVAELERQIAEKKDISEHPTFKRKAREVERSQADLMALREELEALQTQLEEFGPEQKGQLEAELNFLRRKNQGLADKLDEAKATVDRLRSSEDAEVALDATVQSDATDEPISGAIPRSLSADVDRMLEAVGQSQDRLQRLREIVGEGRSREQGLDEGDLEEMAELLALLRAEIAGVRRVLNGLRDELSKG